MGLRQRGQLLTKNNHGFTLVGVLMVLVVLSVLGLSITALASNSLKVSTGERDDQSVFYIAEAGATVEMAEIENKIQKAYEDSNDATSFFSALSDEYKIIKESELSSVEFEKNPGEKIEAKIDVLEESGNGDLRNYKLRSTGYINNKSRVVEQDFTVEWESKNNGFGEMGIFVKDTIKIKNGTITGDVGTVKAGSNSIIATNGHVTGSIFVPNGSEKSAVNKLHWMDSFPNATGMEMGEFPELPPFPSIPNLVFADDKYKMLDKGKKKYIIQDGKLDVNSNNDGCRPIEDYVLILNKSQQFKEFKIDNDCSLIVDTGSADREIVVDHLNLKNGHIIFPGTGKLTIYVLDKITLGSGTTINNKGVTEKINIYLKGSENPSKPKSFELGGAQKIFGSLYAEDANITLGNGGGFNGNIFTGGKSFIVEGGAWSTSPLILAPRAKFEHTNGTITGMIIADSYEMSGGASFKQGELKYTEGPISPGGLPDMEVDRTISVKKKPLLEK